MTDVVNGITDVAYCGVCSPRDSLLLAADSLCHEAHPPHRTAPRTNPNAWLRGAGLVLVVALWTGEMTWIDGAPDPPTLTLAY